MLTGCLASSCKEFLYSVQGQPKEGSGSSLVMQQVKVLALSLQWLGSLMWYGFYYWPKNFHVPQVQPKKKKKKKKKRKKKKRKKKTEKLPSTVFYSWVLILPTEKGPFRKLPSFRLYPPTPPGPRMLASEFSADSKACQQQTEASGWALGGEKPGVAQ